MATWQMQHDAKKLKNDWNPYTWGLIWEYSARAFKWIPTWQGGDRFQKSSLPCPSDESSLIIRRVKSILASTYDFWQELWSGMG